MRVIQGLVMRRRVIMNNKKMYKQPQSDVIGLEIRSSLLADSNIGTNDGYGAPINEGDSDGWH